MSAFTRLAALAVIITAAWTAHPVSAASGASYLAGQSLVAVACPAARTCVVVADSYDAAQASWRAASLWRTTDAGDSFTAQWGETNVYLADVACPSLTVCLAVGQTQSGAYTWRRAIYRTSNGGKSWAAVSIGGDGRLTNVALTAVSCPTVTHCYVVGTGDVKHGGRSIVTGAIYRSTNGSAWKLAGTGHTEYSSLSCATTSTCYAAGTVSAQGASLVSTTNGFASSHEHDFHGDGFSVGGITCIGARSCDLALWFTDQRGKLASDFAEILATSDGGHTWHRRYHDVKTAYLGAITCSGRTTCFALSAGLVLPSTNGGSSWRAVHSIAQKLADVACGTRAACLVVGYRDDTGAAVLIRTATAGQSWQQLLPS
jgi:photosystem II stability/assembly factor-like uncharacterized protein